MIGRRASRLAPPLWRGNAAPKRCAAWHPVPSPASHYHPRAPSFWRGTPRHRPLRLPAARRIDRYPLGVYNPSMNTSTNKRVHACPHSCNCSHREKMRSDEERRDLDARLSRIEGQIRGIRKMVENNAYCNDILLVSAAATAALHAFNKQLLSCHIRTCVVQSLKNNETEIVDELVDTIRKLMS